LVRCGGRRARLGFFGFDYEYRGNEFAKVLSDKAVAVVVKAPNPRLQIPDSNGLLSTNRIELAAKDRKKRTEEAKSLIAKS
jgi:hypothetical protein